jgi:anti-sigma B factor antagonist
VPITDSRIHDGPLIVQQTSESEGIRLALEGEMDLANAETAESMLREALASGGPVVVDLGKLAFLDSTGVAMLVTAMREGGSRLSFLPSEHASVRRLLNLTGLDERMRPAVAVKTSSPAADAETLQPAA